MKNKITLYLSMQGNLEEFEKHFLKECKNQDLKEIAFAVWYLANEQWEAGKKYEQAICKWKG